MPRTSSGPALALFLLAALFPEPAVTAQPLRVQVPHQAGSAVRRALLSARRRLAGESCRRVLSDFDSAVEQGSLGAVLEKRGTTADDHFDSLVFKDGSPHARCARPEILAFTSVGSGTVFVCARSFVRVAGRDPALAEMVLIHEALHTLGLGENPPTSDEITARIEERCGDGRPQQVTLPRVAGSLAGRAAARAADDPPASRR